MSKINWDLVNEKIAIHCKTREEMNELLTSNGERGGRGCRVSDWDEYGDQTCVRISRDKDANYCSMDWYEKNGRDIVEYTSLLVKDKPNVIRVLGLEKGRTYLYGEHKISVDNNYNIINDKTGSTVVNGTIIDMINHMEDIEEIKEMTHKEIEELVGCKVIIVD